MRENKEIRVLGYVRVSTEGQEENTSLKQQKQSIKSYCKSRGWTLSEIFEDVSSGSNMDRDGFREMETRLDENGFGGLVVYKIDRISRSVVDGSVFVKKLFDKDKFLLSITENIDTNTSNGRMFYNLLLCFSENEREVIKERMMTGKRERVKEGKSPSGYIYGYKRDKDKNFVIVEEEGKIIREMFDLYLERENLGDVMREFGNRGYKTRGGKNFTRQNILNLLRHPIFCGKGFRWGDDLIKGDIPKIVTTNKWNKTQKVLDSRSRGRKKEG